jgi:hypothetical protein
MTNASRTAVTSSVARPHSVVFDMQYLWAILGYTNNDINNCNVITLAEVRFVCSEQRALCMRVNLQSYYLETIQRLNLCVCVC